MAVPTFVAAGTGIVVTASPANAGVTCQVGDLLILHVLVDSGTDNHFLSSVSGAEALDGLDGFLEQVVFSSAFPGSVAKHSLYIGRATSTTPSIGVDEGGGGDTYARLYAFRGANAGTRQSDVIENGAYGTTDVASGSTAAISDVAVVTQGQDRLALQFVGVNDDNAVASFTGETGGDWTEAVAEFASATGTDACLQLQTASKAAAGTIDGGSQTMAAADAWGVIGFALIPAITEAWEQKSFRFRNDDGTESTATWKAAADTDVNLALGDAFRLRFLIQNDASLSLKCDPRLQWRLNGGSWADVSGNASLADVRCKDTANLSDGFPTTQQLGAGTFKAGKVADALSIGGATSGDVAATNETEYEWSLELSNGLGGLSDGDVIDFRLVTWAQTPFSTYTQTPSITIGSGAADFPLDAQDGSVAVTGAAAKVVTGRALNDAPGSYAISGAVAGLRPGRVAAASPGVFTLTGVAAKVVADRALNAQPGSYSVVGAGATLVVSTPNVEFAADPGSFALSGVAAGVPAGRAVSASTGSYALTGDAAGLLAARSADAAPASYAVAGAAGVVAGRALGGSPGSYALTGKAAGLPAGRTVAATSASYTVAGSAGVVAGRSVSASSGSYALTGQAAGVLAGRSIGTAPGAYALTGTDAALALPGVYTLDATPASFTLTGAVAGVVAGRKVNAAPGSYALAGEAAGLLADRIAQAAPGTYSTSGATAKTLADRKVTATPGSYAFTGVSTGFLTERVVLASPGTLTLSGAAAILAALLAARIGSIVMTDAATASLALTDTAGSVELVDGAGSAVVGDTAGRVTLADRAGSVALSEIPL